MLAEGVQIYSSIVKVFGGERKRKFFYFLGWGKVSTTFNKLCTLVGRPWRG